MTDPNDKLSVTLPGPHVTRTVTWEQVRVYLASIGWTIRVRDGNLEMWRIPGRDEPGCPTVWVGWWAINPSGGLQVMETTITTLAGLADVSPGEMLARIHGSPDLWPNAVTRADHDALRVAYEKVRDRCARAEMAAQTPTALPASGDAPLLAAVHAWADAICEKRWCDALDNLDLAFGLTKPGRAQHTNKRGAMERDAEQKAERLSKLTVAQDGTGSATKHFMNFNVVCPSCEGGESVRTDGHAALCLDTIGQIVVRSLTRDRPLAWRHLGADLLTYIGDAIRAGIPALTGKAAAALVVEHLYDQNRSGAAGDFEEAVAEEDAAGRLTLDYVAQLAEANEAPDALPFERWERLRPGLGLQKYTATSPRRSAANLATWPCTSATGSSWTRSSSTPAPGNP